MTTPSLDAALRKTLEDHRVSRGEKQALNRLLSDCGVDAHDLTVLRSRAFQVAREEVISPDARAVLDWLEDIVKILQPDVIQEVPAPQAYFTPGDDGPRALTGLIRATRRKADVCVYTITDNRIAEELLAAHRRGVAVRIISDNEKADDAGSDIAALERAGLPVRVDRSENHMHHKFAVFDDLVTVTGSYNWTRSAADLNVENFVVARDPRLARAFLVEFERQWNHCG